MNENGVIAAVCVYLKARGWHITQQLHTSEHGVDVVATHAASGRKCYVEAKGSTSAREGTRRYGKPFDGNQITVHVARAVLTALKLRTEYPDRTAADVLIAVPDERRHRSHLKAIAPVLGAVGVGTLFVADDGTVASE
jgi:hypothetical protein